MSSVGLSALRQSLNSLSHPWGHFQKSVPFPLRTQGSYEVAQFCHPPPSMDSGSNSAVSRNSAAEFSASANIDKLKKRILVELVPGEVINSETEGGMLG